MRAGRLRHRMILEDRTIAAGSLGEQTETWTPRHPIHASVESASNEQTVMDAKETRATHVLMTRYCEIVTERCRLRWGNKTLHITSVDDPDGRRRELRLTCIEVKA